jgi:hypothetical protein
MTELVHDVVWLSRRAGWRGLAMKKRIKRTAFVPTVVFGTAVLGVIPACATGCGGQSSTTGTVKDGSTSDVTFYVAAVGYCAFCDGGGPTVAAIGFDAGLDAGSGGSDAASDGANGEGGDAATNGCPPFCAVAFMAFDAGLDKG